MASNSNTEDAVSQLGVEDIDDNIKSLADTKGADRAAVIIDIQNVELTEEDNKRILRKTDKHILTVLVWVYFLQILDKSALGYGAVLGLREECNLTGYEYSMVSSISAIAQLVWMPFSSWLMVRVPHRILITALVFGWGTAQTCMGACTNYGGLLATRFLLGLFEAACLPLFSIMTSQWYRRAEQPIRVAAWYGTNGLATIFVAAVSYGLGKVNTSISSWRILFIVIGLVTIVTAVVIYFIMDSDIPSARFFTDHEKLQAIERLKANLTGSGSREFKWPQARETLVELKSWLFISMTVCLSITAAVTNTFGPIIVGGFGFTPEIASVMNIPFGAVQILVILLSSWFAYRFRVKSPFLETILLPVLAGAIMLYLLPHERVGALLVAYYMLAFLFGASPILISWIISNTAGTTKNSVFLCVINIGVSTGNIIGPLLFNANDAPYYKPGLKRVMSVTCAQFVIISLQIFNIYRLNRRQERRRVQNGKPAKLHDVSMEHRYSHAKQDNEAGFQLGDNTLKDLTDSQNDEFVFVY